MFFVFVLRQKISIYINKMGNLETAQNDAFWLEIRMVLCEGTSNDTWSNEVGRKLEQYEHALVENFFQARNVNVQ